jgi:hypothetical protein
MVNAAVWLGAAVFCSTALLVAMNSSEMLALLGAPYFQQVSGAVTQIVFTRLYYLQTFCACVAGVHLVAERMYLSRTLRRFWVGLLAFLFLVSLAGSLWLAPKLARLQRLQYASGQTPAQQAQARNRFQVWDGVFQAVNVLMIGGIAVYFWRVTHTQDEPRFVRSVFH